MRAKRILSLLMVVMMAVSLLPVGAMAAEGEETALEIIEAVEVAAAAETLMVEEETPAEEPVVEEIPEEVEETPEVIEAVEVAVEAETLMAEETTYTYDYVPGNVTAASVYEAVTGAALPEGTSVKYLARAAGESLVIELSDLFEADWLVNKIAEITGSDSLAIPMTEVWADVTADYSVPVDPVAAVKAAVAELSFLEYYKVAEVAAKALAAYGCHSFGTQETETVRIGEETYEVQINDMREETSICWEAGAVTYGYTADRLISALNAYVTCESGATFAVSVDKNAEKLDASDDYQDVLLYFPGDDEHKPCTATAQVLVNRAVATIDYEAQIVEQGEDYTFELSKSADVETIEFMLGVAVEDGVDASVMFKLNDELAEALKLYSLVTGEDASVSLSLSDAVALLTEAGELLSMDNDSLSQLLIGMEGVLAELGLPTDAINIRFVTEFHPTEVGMYIAGAAIVDGNYYPAVTVEALVIYPADVLVTLDWADHDYNGIILEPLYAEFDLTAVASDADLQSAVEYIFLGVDPGDEDCWLFFETDPAAVKARNCAIFDEYAYIAPSCEDDRFVIPAARSLAVVPAHLTIDVVDTEIPYTQAEDFELSSMIDYGCDECTEEYILLVKDGDTVNVILDNCSLSALNEYLPDTLVDVADIASVLEDAADACCLRFPAAVVDALVKDLQGLEIQRVILNGAAPTEVGEYVVAAIGYTEYHYADKAAGTLTIRYPYAQVKVDLPEDAIDLYTLESMTQEYAVSVVDEAGNKIAVDVALPITVEGLTSSYADGVLTVDFTNAVKDTTYAVKAAEGAVLLDGIYYDLIVKNGEINVIDSTPAGGEDPDVPVIPDIPVIPDPELPTLKIGNVTAFPGQTVKVPVSALNNPGFHTFTLDFIVVPELTFGVENGIWTDEGYIKGGKLFVTETNEYLTEGVRVTSMKWNNFTQDGEMFYLVFTVPEDAAIGTKYDITFGEKSLVKGSNEFQFVSGSITVIVDPEDRPDDDKPVIGILGDATNDGKVTAADASVILKYVAEMTTAEEFNIVVCDCTGDGKVTAADASAILKYVAEMEPYAVGCEVIILSVNEETGVGTWELVVG